MKRHWETLEEALKHGKPFSDLCRCSRCRTFWWLTDFLRCPVCKCCEYEDIEIPHMNYIKY